AAPNGRVWSLTGAALAAVVLALALPGLAHARPDASSVARTISVGADGATLTLRCPRGAVAMAGAVVAVSPEVTARSSAPISVTEWSFRFAGGPGNARAVVRCVRVPPTRSMRTTSIRVAGRTFEGTVPATGSIRATLRCPGGFSPTGYGFEQAGSGTAIVTAARPGTGAWAFVLENEGSSDTRPTIHIRCLARAARASGPGGSARHPLVVHVGAWNDRVAGGRRRQFTHGCPAGYFSAGAGHSLPTADDIVATREFPFRRRPGRWTFVNPGGGAENARTFLTCLSLRTTFER
ncbi:MAG TPA: hypothetical protein VHG69_11580, partial [Thermoleophilaceae bacterium]|nr:hypothetical protein [Thermoleophilaceae bacterium]